MNRFAIHGVPRSGTSWLGEIINSSPNVCYKYQPLFSYALKGFLSETSSSEDVNEFYHLLLTTKDEFLDQTAQRQSDILPIFSKSEVTHLGYKEVRYHNLLPNMLNKASDIKFVFLLRDPLAVLSSWISAPREFRKDLGWDIREEWRYAESKNQGNSSEFYGYEAWKRASYLFIEMKKKYPGRVQLLNYIDLLENKLKSVNILYDFLGLEFGEQTREFLNIESVDRNISTYSVYRSDKYLKQKKCMLDKDIIDWICGDLEDTNLAYLFGSEYAA